MWKLVTGLMGGLGIVTLAAACSSGGSETAPGTDGSTGTVTVTGQVVDGDCFNPVTKANAGMDHRPGPSGNYVHMECAYACAKWWGEPVALLTADGKLYQLAGGLVANNNEKIAPHMSHTVTITGDVAEKDGISMLTANDLTMAGTPAK